MAQTISVEVRNSDGTTFRQVIKPDERYFKTDPHSLCKDMFGDALVSVNRPIVKEEKNIKKDLEDIEVK